ncbi:MAG TPA: carboxypeptidase regulatory-like domain-containing protein [Vicinamibacterales bacterium]|nr:carboxypeptidase regulatory-like domain-containing protein [Vicinamibacterales bacterium]
MMRWKSPLLALCLALAMAGIASAQEFRGRINGTVSDNTGAVLPGVTVTVSSPALIQPQEQITGADGQFRFPALPPGVYAVDFELSGFQNVKREGVRVVINQTLTVDQQLQVATLQETVTVTGASPIVDTSTNTMGTNFTKELLTEIPNARDVWAAMAQAPGMQMTSYDVGGSRTGNQTGYRAYGLDDQNQTRMEGIDTTEATAANAGYFDFGSFEEFQVSGAGADASAYAGGAVLSISVKSGGDRFTGNFYYDYLDENTIADTNVPDYLRTANTPNEDGFFTRTPLSRGNPVQKQYDLNFNVGGPIWKQKMWFFTSWRLNDQYQYILGLGDQTQRSKLSNKYTLKGTLQLNRNNQVIGFINKREKLQDKRGINLTTPLSAAYYQSSRNYPWKFEWTSVLGGKAFLDVLAGDWYNFFPLRPVRDYGLYDGPWSPGRQDLGNLQFYDGGANNGYQDQKRFKPQFYASMSYFKDGWKGSHDMKGGYDWKRDRRYFFRDQPFDTFYRDTSTNPANLGAGISQVDIYNTANLPTNDVNYGSVWFNDTWKMTDRLTVNLGLRFEAYRDLYPEQEFAPNGLPQLANWPADYLPAERARYFGFIAPRTVEQTVVNDSKTFAPRVGFAYDLTGDNRTVLKAYYGQSRWNSADTLADQENPVGVAQLRYAFLPCTATRTTQCDLNGNGLLDSPFELGAFNSTQGGAGFVRVDRDLKRPVTNEISTSVEREIAGGLSGRASYVYKNYRNSWGEYDTIRGPQYNIPITITDPGPDNNLTTTDDNQTFQTFDRPAGLAQDRVYTNVPDADSSFHTIEFALNRRFANNWMVLTSFGYTWSNMLHEVTGYQRLLGQAAATANQNFLPVRRLFGDNGLETSTIYNYKAIGRYVAKWDIGMSGSWKFQSGQNYGRTLTFTFPNDGARTFRVEPIDARRFPNVSILDVRLDKSFRFGKIGKLTGQFDVFNIFNSGVPTNFRQTTVNFLEVTELLAPRVMRFGVRYDF